MTHAEQQINKLTNAQIKEFITYRHLHSKDVDKTKLNRTCTNYLSSLLIMEEFISIEYGLTIEQLQDFDFFTITALTVEHFINYVVEVKGSKPSTKNQRLVALSSFLKHLLNTYKYDISVEQEKQMNIVIESFQTRETINNDRLMFTKSQISYINRYLANTRLTHRERLLAVFLLTRDTLIQREELLDIKLEHLHLDAEKPHVSIQSKNSNVIRTCYLEQDTVAALNHYLFVRESIDTSSDYLFISNRGVKLYSETLYSAFKDVFINAGFGYIDEKGVLKTDYSLDILRLSFKHHR